MKIPPCIDGLQTTTARACRIIRAAGALHLHLTHDLLATDICNANLTYHTLASHLYLHTIIILHALIDDFALAMALSYSEI